MKVRRRWVRAMALAWATLLVASPGVGALVDAHLGQQVADNRGHVEESSSSNCPQVHPPECGICRHLSSPAGLPACPSSSPGDDAVMAAPRDRAAGPSEGITLSRWGRAPPLV